MKSAKELFEELGYEQKYNNKDKIEYYKDDDNVIYFKLEEDYSPKGFCKCGDCRRGMNKKHIHQPYKDYYYYVCNTFKKNGASACTKHAIRTEIVKDTVLEVIKQYVNVAVTMSSLINFITNLIIK